MPRWTEHKILRLIKKNRRAAYEALVRQNYKDIYRFLIYLTKNKELAEDLTQDTFVTAISNIEKFRAKASIKTWLHKIAYNKFIDIRRRLKAKDNVIDKIKSVTEAALNNDDPLQKLINNEIFDCLYEAMKKLEPIEYDLIVLHYIQGLKYRHIAEVLDVPAGTARWLAKRSLKKLKSFLS